ncbi:MAG: penicillin acylase family protein [Rhodoferax sp.]
MRWLVRGGGVLLGGLLLGGAVLVLYLLQAQPLRHGSLAVAGVQAPVQLGRDAADVTHIEAGSDRDAWFALGWVHAQERAWQLEFNRRLVRGELAAVLGEGALDTDKLMRTLGLAQAAQRQWQGLPEDARAALLAYSAGINAFHGGNRKPLGPEFQLLGLRPGRWLPEDSVGWSLMMALDLGGNWGNEFARLSAAQVLDPQHLLQVLGPAAGEPPALRADLPELYQELDVYRAPVPVALGGQPQPHRAGASPPAAARGVPTPVSTVDLLAWSQDFVEGLGTVEGRGSNNWVLSGERSLTGKPLLANDPHLGLSAPAVWYFAHLRTPQSEAIGATLPGLPFVVLGRTPGVAWGFTNTGPDVQDLYLEFIHPENPKLYRAPDIKGSPAWESFKTRKETIAVKGRSSVSITVRETRHGPVLSDVQRSHGELIDTTRFVLALRWTALDADNRTVAAGLRSNRARSVEELQQAFADYAAPMQNVLMADTQGRIAYRAVGKVPRRKAGNDILGFAPSPGWDARYDWDGWIAPRDLPQDNGAKGWIATANQRITPPGYAHFLGQDWAAPYRYERIAELLAQTPRHDLGSLRAVQADAYSGATARLLPFLQRARSTHPLAAQVQQDLRGFDSVMRAGQAQPLVFAVWVDELTRGLLTPRLGELRMRALYGKRSFRAAVEDILERDDRWWCGEAGCGAQVDAAFTRALARLQAAYGPDLRQWQWGRAHVARSVHAPFSQVAALAPWFEVRVPSAGDAFTVNAGQYWPNDPQEPFANRHAASMRALFDLSDLNSSLFIYQTGQSGLAFSARYADMRDEWAQVRYRPLQMRPSGLRSRLTLAPALVSD